MYADARVDLLPCVPPFPRTSSSMTHSPASSSISSSSPFLTRSVSPSPPRTRIDNTNNEEDLDVDDLEASSPTLSTYSSSPPFHEKHSRRHSSASSLRSLVRRPRVLAIVGILAFLAIFAVFSVVHVSNGGDAVRTVPEVDTEKDDLSDLYPSQVRGPPTESFRDNLRDDVQYITAWIAAGWTNDFMTYVNLLYLALLTNRTAVLPPFAPSHIGSSAGFVDVGDVFDLPRLSKAIGVPIIQWSDLKVPGSEHVDELGCWSIWATAAMKQEEKKPRFNIIEPHLALDVSYTPIPNSAIMLPRPQYTNDPHVRFSSLAALTFPDGRNRARIPAAAPFPAPQTGDTSLPDEQMACFDFPYYVASEAIFEFKYDWSPAWRFVGTHAHWSSWLTNVALDAIRKTFGVEEGEEVPPFISMHVRHGDFGQYCDTDSEDESGCFAPLSTFARRVDEVRQELREKKGIEVERVLVTSDESDAKWWDAVRELGWEWVDHEALGTEEKFGKWYTVFIDAVVQSLGAGFVGTDRSTMSLVAQRRVEDWSDGATREVKWGADARNGN
ncbi:hypothetical protein ACEPAH_1159 [Sanghuangporus vaninii]